MVDSGQFWFTGHGAELSTEELTLTDVHEDAPLLPGTGVDIYFELGAMAAIDTRAVVTKSDGRRVTFRFLDLDPAAERALDAYVSGDFYSSTRIRQRTLSH
jgi:hypothetical protein